MSEESNLFEIDLELEKPQDTFNLLGLFCCHHISDGKKYHFCTSWSISIKSQGYRNRYSLIDKPSGSCSFREKIWPLIFTISEIFFFSIDKTFPQNLTVVWCSKTVADV